LVTRYIDTSLLFTGDDILGPENLKSTEDDQQLFTRGTAHLVSFDGVFDQTVGLSYTKFNQRDFDPNPPNAEASFFNGDRLKADWQGNLNLTPGQVLTLRAEHQRDEITNPIAEITDNAAMIQFQSGFGERFFNAVSVRYDNYDTFGGKATFCIAPALLIPETDTKLKGSVGTGFKAPTLAELFQNFLSFNFFGNPNLKPETSIGYDLGFEQAVESFLTYTPVGAAYPARRLYFSDRQGRHPGSGIAAPAQEQGQPRCRVAHNASCRVIGDLPLCRAVGRREPRWDGFRTSGQRLHTGKPRRLL
jgi:vitamin B12 transporter